MYSFKCYKELGRAYFIPTVYAERKYPGKPAGPDQ